MDGRAQGIGDTDVHSTVVNWAHHHATMTVTETCFTEADVEAFLESVEQEANEQLTDAESISISVDIE